MESLSIATAHQLERIRSLDFVRWLSCRYLLRSAAPAGVSALFLERWPTTFSKDLVTKAIGRYCKSDVGLRTTHPELLHKAGIAPGTTTDPAWAGALVTDKLAEAFFTVARRASLLARIPLREVPFNAAVPSVTTEAEFAWVGEGVPKPVSAYGFGDGVLLRRTKCAGTVVVTDELARLVVPGTEQLLQDRLIAGLTAFTDRQLLDPAIDAVPNVRPASITHGVVPLAGTGDFRADLATLIGALYSARPQAESAVLIMAPGLAAGMSAQSIPFGTTVITSAAAGTNVTALDPSGVFASDDGLAADVALHATLQMNDAPVVGPTAAWTSLWQENLAGFRVERFCGWQAQPGAVQVLTVA